MEAAGEGSDRGGGVKEQKRSDSGGYEDGAEEETLVKVPPVTSMSRSSGEPDPTKSPSSQKVQDDQLQSARAEMGEVREENQRLKRHLEQLLKDYENLQMQFMGIVKKKVTKAADPANKDQEMEEPEFVSLRLGSVSSGTKRDEKNTVSGRWKEDEEAKEGLSLGLDSRFDLFKSRESESVRIPSPVNSSEETKDEAGENCSPSKAQKTMRSGDDEAAQQIPVKKARVSVRTRCDTPTMNDGCQWRKYGQKIAKGNPCPRAYYRCTVAASCPVRKQVQRCAEDMSILITTYEGTHNHPLPMAATAMASTTSAAASMLLSGSSTSRPGHSLSATATASDLQGMNFYLADHSKPKPFYLSNSSYNPSSTFPTITLDLTSLPSSSSSPFNKFSSAYPPRCSTTSLSFSSSEPNAMSWGNGFLSYGAQPYDRNQIGNPAMGRPPVDNAYLSYIQKNNPTTPQNHLQETIAAATKAITADPSFQSALAAALTTIIGNGGAPGNQSGGGDNHGQKSTMGELFPASSTFPPASKGTGCASSFLNLTHSTTSRPGSLMFLPPSLPFSAPKSASTSPGDKRDPTKEF